MGEGRKDDERIEDNTTPIARQPSEDEMDNIPRPTCARTEGAMDNEHTRRQRQTRRRPTDGYTLRRFARPDSEA